MGKVGRNTWFLFLILALILMTAGAATWAAPSLQQITPAEIEMMVEIVKREPAYIPPILRTVATEGLGVDGLCNAIFSHYDYLQEHGLLEEKVRVRIMDELLEIINHRVHLSVTDALEHDPEMLDLMKKLVDTREIDPHSGAAMVIRHLMKRE